MAALAAIDRCEKDAIIRQGISPGMYRCVGTACTHAGRSSTRAGPVHGFGLAEMHGDSRSCVQSAARSNDDCSPAGESPCMHNQRGRKKASLSLSHKVQECATSCLYNDTIRPVLFQDLLCHLYTHAFCAFFPSNGQRCLLFVNNLVFRSQVWRRINRKLPSIIKRK